MDSASLSRYPHLSWLTTTFLLRCDTKPTAIHLRSVAHSVSMPVAGRHAVRWLCRSRERTWTEHPGTVHVRPCSWEWQDFVIHSADPGDVLACFIPPGHLEKMTSDEGMDGDVEWRRVLLPDDVVLRQSLLTLSACGAAPADGASRAEEAARRLVLRLVELSGGGAPDWRDDVSVFDTRTLGQLVEYVDAHLALTPSLGEMGLRECLSPSHFAKKFRQSTGLSFHRFVNRRRIRSALALLKDQDRPLAGVARDLGFSSQSHFTRLFSGLTGMTPAKYRRLFRRTLG